MREERNQKERKATTFWKERGKKLKKKKTNWIDVLTFS